VELVLIASIAFVVSSVSGLLGLGGAVFLIPAYLYLPKLFGIAPLDVKSISGVTSVQVFATALLGTILHKRHGAVNKRLVLVMGIPIIIASFLGAMLSGGVSASAILGVFAAMAITGAAFMVTKKGERAETDADLSYSSVGAAGVAAGVGFFGGMVGAPGAFLLSPLMMSVLHIPTRITIGSTLGIVLLSALAASAGKITTGLVPLYPAIAAIIGSLPGVALGSMLSHRLRARTLRWALAVFIGAVGVQMGVRLIW
jgi:uncharacterized membrane protein YfcA